MKKKEFVKLLKQLDDLCEDIYTCEFTKTQREELSVFVIALVVGFTGITGHKYSFDTIISEIDKIEEKYFGEV